MINQNNSQQQAGPLYIYMLSFVAALGGFLFGYDLAVISGAIIFLEKFFDLSPAMQGLAVTSAGLGCLSAPILGWWAADYFGRKKMLIISCVFLMVSAIGSALASTIFEFNIWRWVGGIGIGFASIISPAYIAEIAPEKMRGRLVTVNQLAIVVGVNVSIITAYFLSFGEHWRWMFALEAVPIVFFFGFLFYIPNSPRWLAMKSKNVEALGILTKINGRSKAAIELEAINTELKQETGSLKELLKPGIRRALLIGMMLMLYGQIYGINMVHVYAPSILVDIGIGSPSVAILNAMYINMFMLVCVLIAFWAVGRFARRTNLYVGFIVVALAHLLMAASIQFDLPNYMLLGAMLAMLGVHQFTTGPVIWVINSEIFPNRLRGTAMSLAIFILYAGGFVTTFFFPIMEDWFKTNFGNTSGVYIIFFVICVTAIIFTWRLVPETKDLALEKISEFWLKDNNKKLPRE